MSSFPPALILLLAAAAVLVLPWWLRRWVAFAVPAAVFAVLFWVLEPGDSWTVQWLSLELMPLRVDALSLVFGYVFALIAAIGAIYGWHMRDKLQQAASLAYAGSSLGVVFAGDLMTLIIFWELMAIASAYLILGGKQERSISAGKRYLFVHVVGGTALLAGVLWHLGDGGSLLFNAFEGGPAAWLVLFGFAVNAAIPPLHAWLPDAYPEGSVTGAIFLSAFTTKTAVYVLARGFPGWDLLVPAGVFMALYGLVFAVLENDMRRLLAYHIVSQVGYMVAAVGIGTEAAINGASAHAFAHVLYKGLLLMGTGAVIHATGKRRMTELGGIYPFMKVTFLLYMIGGLSISAFPLFSGFTTKALVIHAAEEAHLEWAALLLYVASVGTFLHTGLKLPYATWLEPRKDPPPVGRIPGGMYIGMGILAFLCIAIGVYPAALYAYLPYPETYNAYTPAHIIHTIELLIFTALGFWLFLDKLHPTRTVSLDTDWFYRKAGRPALLLVLRPLEQVFTAAERATNAVTGYIANLMAHPERPWTGVVRLLNKGKELTPEDASRLLARPPLGVAVGFVLVTFIAVALIATAMTP